MTNSNPTTEIVSFSNGIATPAVDLSSQYEDVLSSKSDISKIRHHVPIAICGYSYRLPGGLETDNDFWELLARRGYVQESVDNRYGEGASPLDGFTVDNPMCFASPWEGLIRDGRELEFDCSLFGISMNDAKRMDPQIKMMLMATWEALQCAGYDQAALHNSNTGVFTGIQTSSISGWRPLYGAKAGDVPGKSGSMIANRISFHFNWMGPSFSVATACSSGITALDAAVKSLDVGECDLAAFGAVHYLGLAQGSVGFNALGIISKTGSSRSFDKDANGYMRSEGAFVYLLKRLDDAERDGDKIFGVIRGCALNTAGAEEDAEILTQGRMIVAPVMHAQQKLMSRIVNAVGIDPTTVDYLEAHATGTVLGDATEGNAIANVYGSPDRKFPLRLSSVRSNLGHMESASFTCSLLKVLLMLQHRTFAPISSHHQEPTEKIPFEARNMKIQTEVEPFPVDRTVTIGINSFGFGGANGHCLIEEYKAPETACYSTLPKSAPENKVYMIPLSAKSDEALVENARRLANTLPTLPSDIDMYTLVGNLSVRMTHHRVRTSLTAVSMDELKDKLTAFAERSDIGEIKEDEITRIQLSPGNDPVAAMERGNILMIFPGQGSQWAGCGRELYDTELVFRRVVDAIDAEWMKLSGVGTKLSSVAFDSSIGDKLNECCWAQPVTFLLQVAMYELFLSHGIYPKAVMGHSAGEPGAAYASGAYTLEEACYLVYHRSRLQTLLAGCGRMLVLMMDATSADDIITKYGFSGQIEIACYNSPSNTVVCGAEEIIMQLREKLEADKQPAGTLIAGNIAFHSQHMMPIKEELLDILAPLDKNGPRCGSTPMISTVTGKYLSKLDAEYWWKNVRHAVDLLSAITTADKYVQPQVMIELSPHITLRSPIRDYYNDIGEAMPTYIYTLVRKSNTADMFAQSLGSCFKAGLPINFSKFFPRPAPITHYFPPYMMKREQVIDIQLDEKALSKKEYGSAGPILGRIIASDHLSFEAIFSKKHFQWMADHIVQGQPLVPAAAYLELVFEAFRGKKVHIEVARILTPFLLTNDPANLYTEFVPIQHAQNKYDFRVYSRQVDQTLDHKLHGAGTVEVISDDTIDNFIPTSIARNIADDKESNFTELVYKDRADFYNSMAARIGQSFGYGPYFQAISKCEFDRTLHRMRFDITIDKDLWKAWDSMGYIYHPSMLDGALQTFLVYLMESADFSGVPQMVKNMTLLSKPSSEHIIVVYNPPDYLRDGKFHQKGQLAFALGERSAGNCTIYDGVTGDLITYLGDYTSYGSNSRLSDLRRVKHYLQWQPKDGCQEDIIIASAVGELTTGGSTASDVPNEAVHSIIGTATQSLIRDIMKMGHPTKGALFFVNAAECVIGMAPDKLALEDCLQLLLNAPVQYSVLAGDAQYLTDCYQKLGSSNADANLRFANINDDPTVKSSFVRPKMFEMVLIRVNIVNEEETDEEGKDEELLVSNEVEDELEFAKEKDEFIRATALVAPGAIVLIETACVGKDLSNLIPDAWTCLWKGRTTASNVAIYKSSSLVPAIKENHEVDAPVTVEDNPATESLESSSMAESVVSEDIKPTTENKIVTTIIENGLAVAIDDSLGFSEFWKSDVRDSNILLAETDFEQSLAWERIDYFAMNNSDVNNNENDPELFDSVSKLTDFVKEIGIRRSGNKNALPCVFSVYTSGAMHNVTSPSQTGIWGAVRSLAVEVGDACAIDFRLIDVATKEDLLYAPAVECMRERELCIHNGRLWTCRLINNRNAMPMTDITSDNPDSFKLTTNNSGLLSDLEFRVDELPPLEPYEIEVSVKAAALNFRDIMIGLGRLPLLSFEASMLGRTVGMECSGEVVRVGSDVKDHVVGDKVLAMQGGCIANRLKCHEKAAYRLPSTLTYEEGSATASVYVTAYYALVHLAKMTEGSTVLVHSALGGVGQAAIALAKLYGAKIYGTAGSEEKRASLIELGCAGAFDSHSTKWYPDLMAATNGKGVDIVLNSLAGEHIDLCLEALSPGGFHCEIGKVDIFLDRPMKMSVFRKNIAFRAIDVDRLMTDDPYLTRELSVAVLALMEAGKVPPLPCTVFSYNDYQDALRCMMNGQHRGKLVLTPPGPGETIRVVDDRKIFGKGKDGSDRTILMSGCLGGFGLRVLSYVIALGGRNIVLMDRDPERKRDVQWVLDHSFVSFLLGHVEGLRIEIVYGDVGVYDHVTTVVQQIEKLGMPPLGSVFHLAGILDDKKVEDIDRESFAKVYQPKANGAWNLHRATLDCKTVDHFVMFSSTSSAFGNHGQTNYSAANSYQDGLAALRHRNGMPALSFCMGAVIEAGMASRNPQLLQMMKAGGMPPISCIFAIEALDAAIRDGTQWNSVAALAKDLPANFDSTDYLRTVAQLIRNNVAFKMGDNSNLSKEALVELLSERVGKLCGVDKLDPTEPFSSYGLNSISVAELATYLKNEMSYTVSAMELMTSATCESIAEGIMQASQASAEEGDNKDNDDGTAATGPESDSGTVSTDGEQVWSAPLIRRPSLFEPAIQEYFVHPPPPQLKGFVEQDIASFMKVDSGKVEKETNSISDPLKNLGVGVLDGELPLPVQEQLDELKSFIDSLDVTNVKESVSVKDIKRVLVTGATGFVGRHFIAELLNNQSHYIEKIYCPIRANSDIVAKDRLVDAMMECGTWNEDFSSRLHVFSGDLADEYLGLSTESYKELTGSIDAVYHFASSLNLAAPFAELRKGNCKTMRPIFRLCLQGPRRKHLFLTSTLGIFPQYFTLFSNEFTDKAIARNAMPEIAQMKKIFPLGIGGYAWSKVVNELASYKAQKSKGLSLAVFRLPVMFTNSKTGYSVNGDPWVRMFFASLQLRLIPGQGRLLLMEDSAASNEMMLKVSLNPARRNTVYHCSYQSHVVQSQSTMNDMMGFPCEHTSYENFKSQCLKLGPDSPVNSYWALLDHFADYWVNFKSYASEFPIDCSTLEEDCFPMPSKSNSLQVLCKSLEWADKQDPASAPLNVKLLQPSTDLESVLTPSRKLCASYKMDFNSVVKPHVIEGLRRICCELHSRKFTLPEVILSLTMRLEARVHLHRLLELHPEINDESIESPLFVLGLNRTGTTFLHRILEASGRFEAPHAEDQLALPSVEQIAHPDEDIARTRLAAIGSFLQNYASAADGIHEVELGVAEEDMVSHASSFMSLEYDVLYDLPNYRKWLESQDMDVVYEEHRSWMQFIAWWRRQQNPNCGSRWCYKFPWHLRSLNSLIKVYPDARFVHTHRDIQDVASSWCSLVKGQRARFIENIDDSQLGKDELQSLSTTLKAGIDFRKQHPEMANKWMDVHYNDLIAAPAKITQKIIIHAGLTVTEDVTNKINLFVKQSIAKRDTMILHKPKYQDYGITTKDFETSVFKNYNNKSRGMVSQFLTPPVLAISVSTDQLLMVGVAFGAGVIAALLVRPN